MTSDPVDYLSLALSLFACFALIFFVFEMSLMLIFTGADLEYFEKGAIRILQRVETW